MTLPFHVAEQLEYLILGQKFIDLIPIGKSNTVFS